MLKAAIFDMDGLLIDSEPLWRKAEIAVFARVGLNLTEDQCAQTMGMRIDEVVQLWFERHPWERKSPLEVRDEIVQEVENLVQESGTALQGVAETLAFCQQQGLRIALASSSSMRLITCVLQKLAIQDAFEVVHSAEFEEYGKPHPAIFISTSRLLGVPPAHLYYIRKDKNIGSQVPIALQ